MASSRVLFSSFATSARVAASNAMVVLLFFWGRVGVYYEYKSKAGCPTLQYGSYSSAPPGEKKPIFYHTFNETKGSTVHG